MGERSYRIHCRWDPEGEVWVAESEDVPGLATGGETLDELIDKLRVVVPELLEANGLITPDGAGEVALAVSAERHVRAARAA